MKRALITVIVPLGEHHEHDVIASIKNQEEKVKMIIEVGPNPPQNRNRGVKRASTQLIAFVNGHTILPSDWSKKIRLFFENYPSTDIVGGPQLTHPAETYFGKVSGYALASIFGSAESSTRYVPRRMLSESDERYLTSANLICRKQVFDSVLFNETLYPGEDPKFIADAKMAGLHIFYNPEIIVYNKRRKNIRELSRQIFTYGKTRSQQRDLTRMISQPSFIVPSIFVLYLIFFGLLASFNKIFIIPLIAYILLALFFSFYESQKHHHLRACLTLLTIFFTIQIAYGIGFLYGLFIRNKQ